MIVKLIVCSVDTPLMPDQYRALHLKTRIWVAKVKCAFDSELDFPIL